MGAAHGMRPPATERGASRDGSSPPHREGALECHTLHLMGGLDAKARERPSYSKIKFKKYMKKSLGFGKRWKKER